MVKRFWLFFVRLFSFKENLTYLSYANGFERLGCTITAWRVHRRGRRFLKPLDSSAAGNNISLPFRTRYPPRVDTERNDMTATPKGVVPPCFRRISNFPPFRLHRKKSFRQTHFSLLLRFRQTTNFVPFRVHRRGPFRHVSTEFQVLFRSVSTAV